MRWHLRFGDSFDYLLEIERDTGVTPEPLQSLPSVPPHLSLTWETFLLLSRSRPLGFGAIGGISTADIMAVAPCVAPENPVSFLRVIRAMDAIILEDFERASREQSKKKSKQPGRR